MARSSVNATAIATPIIDAIPKNDAILSILGRAININAARGPPIRINGLLRPPQNHTLSLIIPTMTCPNIPANGPAAHTIPISCISKLYFVFSIQLRAAICIESANPIAVDGRLNKT